MQRHALKEHLMLLINSMTCAESLIGLIRVVINLYLALSNIQVPFTETLFTLRRCFERATEKCYDDSLSSIVASYSWDKHMIVGTKSWFDVLWD